MPVLAAAHGIHGWSPHDTNIDPNTPSARRASEKQTPLCIPLFCLIIFNLRRRQRRRRMRQPELLSGHPKRSDPPTQTGVCSVLQTKHEIVPRHRRGRESALGRGGDGCTAAEKLLWAHVGHTGVTEAWSAAGMAASSNSSLSGSSLSSGKSSHNRHKLTPKINYNNF